MRRIRTTTVRVVSLLMFILLALSCTDEVSFETPETVTVGFVAGNGATRTTMLPNGLSASWVAGDEIAVWAKNSSGTFSLSNQVFTTFGIDKSLGYFTSTLGQPMADGTYTYYCCYPVPESVNGTKATFTIPSVQDGKVTSGADIMIATPVQHGPLKPITAEADNSAMSMQMNRMLHQFRFYIPNGEGTVLGGQEIKKIELTFPKAVSGSATYDLSNPSATASQSLSQTKITLDLKDPINESTSSSYDYACVAFAPTAFSAGESLKVRAFTEDKIAEIDPIDLCSRTFQAGHSTPVKLKIRELVDYKGIIYLAVAANNLGENPKKITLTAPAGCKWGDNGTNVLVYEPGREILVGETIAVKFETDLDAYKAFSGQQISIVYDSENALMSETLTMPTISGQGKTNVSLTVPYLLFEDFSCVYAEGESYGNNSYSSSEREQPGSSLDGYMSHTGWNAARYWTKGNSIRINTRYQCVGAKVLSYNVNFLSYHHGRLDTPPLSGLKAGKAVTLKMFYDAGGYLHDDSSSEATDPTLCVATHSNAGVLDGIPIGNTGEVDIKWSGFTPNIIFESYSTSLNDFGTRQSSEIMGDDYGSTAFSEKFPTYEASLKKATSSTRIAFYVIYTGSDGIKNAEFNVYIDNIKVQITK